MKRLTGVFSTLNRRVEGREWNRSKTDVDSCDTINHSESLTLLRSRSIGKKRPELSFAGLATKKGGGFIRTSVLPLVVRARFRPLVTPPSQLPAHATPCHSGISNPSPRVPGSCYRLWDRSTPAMRCAMHG